MHKKKLKQINPLHCGFRVIKS